MDNYQVPADYSGHVAYGDNSNNPAYYGPNPQQDQSNQYLQYQQPPYAEQSATQPYPPNLPRPAYQQQPAVQPVQYPPPAGIEVQYVAAPHWPIMQPAPVQANTMGGVNTEGWRTGLFDCMDDPQNAATTFLFPCFTFGEVAEIVDSGTTSCETGALMYTLVGLNTGMPCIYSCMYRAKLRSMFGLAESPAPDWILHFLFGPCAICQEYRELDHRGLDPSIGWSGNVLNQQQAQRQQQAATMPPMNQRMRA